jgi:DNA-binding IclR family transcriptional regulator
VPGSIQSIERAAAILRVLASGPGPMRLTELSASLDLPKGTTHGIVRTLAELGFVDQDRVSGRYRLGAELADLRAGRTYLDGNELRARSMNWADPLAARTGEAVRVAMLAGADVLVVHYVFRPDHSAQQADVGARLPGHATALGKVLLAHTPGRVALLPRARDGARGVLTFYTARTIVQRGPFSSELAQVRSRGHAVEYGEHLPDQAAIAAPIFGGDGLPVGAVGIHGHLDRLCDSATAPRMHLVAQVMDCARAITRELQTSRAGE